jgi:hypothetical protein
MAASFFLGNDAELYTGSNAFSDKISATPTAFGLTAPLAASYATVNDIYAAAYLAANAPETRTKSAIEAKNQAKVNLKAMAADLAKLIDGTASVTNAQRIDLGLNVPAAPAPAPIPGLEPGLEVMSVDGFDILVRLRDKGDTARRGRPLGVIGASIFTHVGPTAPTDISGFTFQANTGRTKFKISLPGTTLPGAKVWICAFWFNNRKQSGPACEPVGTNLPGGGVSMAA